MPSPTRGYSGLLRQRPRFHLASRRAGLLQRSSTTNALQNHPVFYVWLHSHHCRLWLGWFRPASGLFVNAGTSCSRRMPAGRRFGRASVNVIVTMKALDNRADELGDSSPCFPPDTIPSNACAAVLEGRTVGFLGAGERRDSYPEIAGGRGSGRGAHGAGCSSRLLDDRGGSDGGWLTVFRSFSPTPPLFSQYLFWSPTGGARLSFLVSSESRRVPAWDMTRAFTGTHPEKFLAQDLAGDPFQRAPLLTVLGIAYFWMLARST